MMRRALAISEALYGPDHPDAGILLINLGTTLEQQGRVAEGGDAAIAGDEIERHDEDCCAHEAREEGEVRLEREIADEARSQDGLRARRRASLGGARLEGDVECGPARGRRGAQSP